MMTLIFARKVIPAPTAKDRDLARVETKIQAVIDGIPHTVGTVSFPSKQSWTKFWGAVEVGSKQIKDLAAIMEDVPLNSDLPKSVITDKKDGDS